MSLSKKNVVVIGATGVVGSGVTRKFLDVDANVVAVSRSDANLERLSTRIGGPSGAPFRRVVADFKDWSGATAAAKAIDEALEGKPIDHVISVQGFVAMGRAPTQSDVGDLSAAFADGLYNNFLAAKALLPALRGREGSSFTLVSGGLAHFPPPNPLLWLGTMKNAALNALTFGLVSETAHDKVRVNTVCIHFGVAPVGGDRNQLEMPAVRDTMALAPAFLAIASGSQKGELLCLSSWDDVASLAS